MGNIELREAPLAIITLLQDGVTSRADYAALSEALRRLPEEPCNLDWWYIDEAGMRRGPLRGHDLVGPLLAEKVIATSTYVWRVSMADWQPLKAVVNQFALESDIPIKVPETPPDPPETEISSDKELIYDGHHVHISALERDLHVVRQMGRIMVYSTGGDYASKQVKALLSSQGVKYHDIDIDVHPEKLDEVVRLTGRRHMPQVFFNGVHVGGLEEIKGMIESDVLDSTLFQSLNSDSLRDMAPKLPLNSSRYSFDRHGKPRVYVPTALIAPMEVGLEAERAKETRLSISNATRRLLQRNLLARKNTTPQRDMPSTVTPADPADEEERWGLVILDVVQQMSHPVRGVPMRDVFVKFKRHRYCFSSKDCVDWLRVNVGCTIEAAIQLSHGMSILKQIQSISGEDTIFESSEASFYRFRESRTYEVLNKSKHLSFSFGSRRGPTEVAEQAALKVQSILNTYHPKGFDRGLNTESIKASGDYREFTGIVKELTACQLKDLRGDDMLPFFLNVYTALLFQIYVSYGVPPGQWSRAKLFNRVCYSVGGLLFSLFDIEHGILRGNRKPPNAIFRRFESEIDERRSLSVSSVNPCVVFALGAVFEPAVRVYTASEVHVQLLHATQEFLKDERHLRVNLRGKELCLPKELELYEADYGGLPEGLMWSMRFLSTHTLENIVCLQELDDWQITYLPLQWPLSDKAHDYRHSGAGFKTLKQIRGRLGRIGAPSVMGASSPSSLSNVAVMKDGRTSIAGSALEETLRQSRVSSGLAAIPESSESPKSPGRRVTLSPVRSTVRKQAQVAKFDRSALAAAKYTAAAEEEPARPESWELDGSDEEEEFTEPMELFAEATAPARPESLSTGAARPPSLRLLLREVGLPGLCMNGDSLRRLDCEEEGDSWSKDLPPPPPLPSRPDHA